MIDAQFDEQAQNGLMPYKRPKVDKEKKRLEKQRRNWEEKQAELKEKEQIEALKAEERNKLPQDRRSSIDLDETPVKPMKFNQIRKALVLKFFTKHFILMTRKSYEYKAYAQAVMYIQHIENLLELLSNIPTEVDGQDLEQLKVSMSHETYLYSYV